MKNIFIWDFAAELVLGQIMNWLYAEAAKFLGDFFAMMSGMGSDLFGMPWVQAIVLFFSYFGWSLYAVGLVVSVFETAIAANSGRADIGGKLLDALKGFVAVSLFTVAVNLVADILCFLYSLTRLSCTLTR